MGATSNNGPVLHGLCTLGYAVRAVLRHAGDLKSSIKPKLISVECNFVKPVFVGDSLKVVVWDQTELTLQAKKSLRLVFIIYRMSSNGKYVQIDKNDVDGKLFASCLRASGKNKLDGKGAAFVIIEKLWEKLQKTHKMRII